MMSKQYGCEDEAASPIAEAASGLNRRRLLGAAAGGFVLAASGLLLPPTIEKAEAREGALGGAKGGRRGKNRKGRHKQRSHGDKKDKQKDQDKPRGNILYADKIKFNVEVAGSRPVKVDHYFRYFNRKDDRWELKESKTLAPGNGATFSAGSLAALWIDNRYWVEAESLLGFGSPAKLKMGYNGSIAANPVKWQGGTIAFYEEMPVGRSTIPMVIDGFSTQVTRLANEGEGLSPYDVFKVVLAAPA